MKLPKLKKKKKEEAQQSCTVVLTIEQGLLPEIAINILTWKVSNLQKGGEKYNES